MALDVRSKFHQLAYSNIFLQFLASFSITHLLFDTPTFAIEYIIYFVSLGDALSAQYRNIDLDGRTGNIDIVI